MTFAAPAGRDRGLDLLRGMFVVTMTFEHLAPESVPSRIMHAPVAFDGASGFIMMSGLVLGMVQRSRIRREGRSAVLRSLVRRAAQLYMIQVAAVTLALLVGMSDDAAPWLPRAEAYGTTISAASAVLLLQVNPQNVDILSLYVALLLLAAACVGLLERGHWRLVVLASVLLYGTGALLPAWTTLQGDPQHLAYFNWGTWQLLFIAAFVGGWHWRQKGLQEAVRARRSVLVAMFLVVSISAIALISARLGPSTLATWFVLSSKEEAGPLRIVMAFAVFVVAYAAVAAALQRWPSTSPPFIERIGRYSLRSFVLLTVLTIVLRRPEIDEGPIAVLLPYLALAAMVVVARRKARPSLSRPLRLRLTALPGSQGPAVRGGRKVLRRVLRLGGSS